MLSDKDKRRRYDILGHEVFLKNEDSVDAADEDMTGFHFSFSDFFHEFDDGLFMEEPHFHWSFHHDEADQDDLYEHSSFDGPFTFHFGSEDEN